MSDLAHGDTQNVIMSLLCTLLDRHYLAVGTFDIRQLEAENRGRALVMGVDIVHERLHVRVCAREDYEHQVGLMQAAIVGGDT
jgi:hypothetical protein